MESSTQLAQRFREVMLNGKWIANTNYKEQLTSVDWKTAVYKIYSFNTIAALTFHINYYISGLLRYFETGILDIHDQFSFDSPPISSNDDWEARKTQLWVNTERLASHVANMSTEELESVFADEKYGTCRRNIEAMTEHAYYHLGQIVLIKKAIAGMDNNGL